MEETVKDRLILFLKYKGIGQVKFAKTIGVSTGYVNNIRRSIQPDKILSISKHFPELNTGWLLTGEGDMLLKSNIAAEEPIISYTVGVPYYNVDFIGGFDIVMNDQTVNPEYLINFRKYNQATCWCNVTGHSMEPEINHGDIIALKRINDFTFLPFGEVYAIVTTNDMRTIKRLGPSQNEGCYSLIPSNKSPEYGVQDIPKSMLKAVYQVLGCMKRL